ncbi:TPA: hypothetical protein QHN36_003540 [Enterobacter bugandensis]|nr:hypothetical protein [Enterobacter bugandensis]
MITFLIFLVFALYVCGGFIMIAFMKETSFKIEWPYVLGWPFIAIGSMFTVTLELIKKWR